VALLFAWWFTRSQIKVDAARLADVPGMDNERVITAYALARSLADSKVLKPSEVAGLMAIAYKESRFDARVRSPDAAPDAAVGHSWGLFQFTAPTLETLGISLADITPVANRDGTVSTAELVRTARGSAAGALKFLAYKPGWTGGRSYLEAVRAKHPKDEAGVLRDIFVSWTAGASKTFDDIEDVAPNSTPGSMGYTHFAIRSKFDALPWFLWALHLTDKNPEG